MKFTAIRHATCIIEFANIKFLVDPILYQKETLDPTPGSMNKMNPLVDIPVTDEILKDIDAILLTHTHRDHFDPNIIYFFGKNVPIICSNEYEQALSELGFDNIMPIKDYVTFQNITITVTKGMHGTGAVGKSMGNTYGFVLQDQTHGEEPLYITGDTVWCQLVKNTIDCYAPKYIIAFAGSAMINNEPVTMDENDIRKLLDKAPTAKIIAIHMEAWNHCRLLRSDLRKAIANQNLYIPMDGETIS